MQARVAFLLVLVVIGGMLTGCAGRNADDSVGLPNPASVHCEEQGGELETLTGEDGGQYGLCRFADGSACEEWALYRGECAPGDEFPAAPTP
jgi:putative hemolysin